MDPRGPDIRPGLRATVINRGTSGRLEVAFTFDAGEGAGHTPEILDLLDDYEATGTFGITGQWAERHPELVRRMVGRGHGLMNHGYDHASFTGVSTGTRALTPDARRHQVLETESIVNRVTHGTPTRPYFRFPYGDYDGAALDLLGELGFTRTMWWSCDSLGWRGAGAGEIMERCGFDADGGGPGAIILMHVANDNDWRALELLLVDYVETGHALVSVHDLLQP